jgi:hypothetical protein
MNPMFFGHNVVTVAVAGLNTRSKRAMAIGVDAIYRVILPAPDGTVAMRDRYQVTGKYNRT